ncbi:hypothetical protein APR43_19425 [Flavobacterium sp. NLM]|nr:hypothetical protein AKO67_21970 [Flavobacterium sp. VMW]OWU89365.1 hypothetical protein APR43_19425 [Flavobacterium sp. NLM]
MYVNTGACGFKKMNFFNAIKTRHIQLLRIIFQKISIFSKTEKFNIKKQLNNHKELFLKLTFFNFTNYLTYFLYLQ